MLIINELFVKVTISDDDPGGGGGTGAGGGDSEAKGTDAIISACVEKVLEILNEMKER